MVHSYQSHKVVVFVTHEVASSQHVLMQVTRAGMKNIKITGSDWTDVALRKDAQSALCKIASGTNPTTGVDTKESLMCPGS